MTVLVVDDSAVMRSMITRAVSLCGVPVERTLQAGDGQAALDILQREDVQVLLTDINMPVMTGIELLRHLATEDRWKDLVRVVISTDGSERRRAEAESLRVTDYVTKPIRPEVMRDVLSHAPARA